LQFTARLLLTKQELNRPKKKFLKKNRMPKMILQRSPQIFRIRLLFRSHLKNMFSKRKGKLPSKKSKRILTGNINLTPQKNKLQRIRLKKFISPFKLQPQENCFQRTARRSRGKKIFSPIK